ncbi:RNA polymerase sigma factor [Stieleria sp. TO1_6]|uniref:RNA polymerase sigma factor n=1 Tax=Stieleria tagensis TaxID=2956795 RepID=UPI00209AFCA6|nr:RNA polymerase sigma factor [Stieleria tagensis]MCO8120874.1 RNA polymerase sigma factor [Stieleria tagensis]
MSDLRKTNERTLPTDALVHQCINGDRDAMAQLYERCSGRVYALMVRIVGRQDADDAMQLAFLQIFRKLDRFGGNSSLETWIYRVATNEALQLLRRRKRDTADTFSLEPETNVSPSGLRLEDAEMLQTGLAAIEPQLRAILTLREVQELSYAEIAEVMDIPEGTVGSRLNRARRELRSELERLGWG